VPSGLLAVVSIRIVITMVLGLVVVMPNICGCGLVSAWWFG
jgi:hypothetical protein